MVSESAYTCSYSNCEEEFDSQRGLSLHETKIHENENSRVNTNCDYCDSPMTIQEWRFKRSDNHFCNTDCRSSWQSENLSGEDNPVYSKKEYRCSNCGKIVKRAESQVRNENNVFCSRNCYSEHLCEEYSGKNAPGYEGGKKIEKKCTHCSKLVERFESEFSDSGRVFCSSFCYEKWQSENLSGYDSYNWKGGYGLYRCLRGHFSKNESWNKKRKRIREEHDNKCYCCDKENSQLEKELSVHHIIPLLCSGTNGDWNLIPLCENCHKKIEKYTKQNIVEFTISDFIQSEVK